MALHAAVPAGAGTIISVEWDLDGSGRFAIGDEKVDGTEAELTRTRVHAFGEPGTYFVTAKVCSHREGDVSATWRRVPNLAQVRVVVR